MTKHFCDDCGRELRGAWLNGQRFGHLDLDLCQSCYEARVAALDKPAEAIESKTPAGEE